MAAKALRDPILIPLEQDDIQSLLLDGHAHLDEARFLLIRFGPRDLAADWLARLRVSCGRRPSARRDDPAVQVAFTFPGLAHLGLDPETLARFSRPFVDGMVPRDWRQGGDHRCRALGDVGENAPDRWSWGGDDAKPWHGILLLYAADVAQIGRFAADRLAELRLAQIQFRALPDSRALRDRHGNFREHFGFADGIGNPILEGTEGPGPTPPVHTVVAPGEILLGYPGEDEQLPPSPRISAGAPGGGALPGGDLGRNGSYLVVRQLEQHVGRFWRFLLEVADGKPDLAISLAARMVGRWPNGAPLAKWSTPPGRMTERPDDDFVYEGDPHGLACPLGAHIRRANPRDMLPQRESSSTAFNSRRRRLLRRGRPYGPPLAKEGGIGDTQAWIEGAAELEEEDDRGRGLLFLAFNADLERQFEFVQQSWVLSRKFAGLANDPDPLLSNPQHPDGVGPGDFSFLHAGRRVRVTQLRQFVTVRGGAYCFMPGARALRYLAGAVAALAARERALGEARAADE